MPHSPTTRRRTARAGREIPDAEEKPLRGTAAAPHDEEPPGVSNIGDNRNVTISLLVVWLCADND